MFKREAKVPAGERMQFVTIVTPNNMHYPITMAAVDAGFHVLCENPMTTSMDEALNLQRKLVDTGKLFCLCQSYTAYAMVRKARELVADGALGKLRRVTVEYPQGWLATRRETAGDKQAGWRTDPRRAGKSGCFGELGSHGAYLAEFITGQQITEVSADLSTFIAGRQLDDDGNVLLRFAEGARGVMWASQVAIGDQNGLRLRVYGSEAALDWAQSSPHELVLSRLDEEPEVFKERAPRSDATSRHLQAFAVGQGPGFVEAYATIYEAFATTLQAHLDGKPLSDPPPYPRVEDGIRGIAFTEALVRNSEGSDKWTPVVLEV
jgi:predicted dehydrogenase